MIVTRQLGKWAIIENNYRFRQLSAHFNQHIGSSWVKQQNNSIGRFDRGNHIPSKILESRINKLENIGIRNVSRHNLSSNITYKSQC